MTRTPTGTVSSAAVRVRPMTASLLATYCVRFGKPLSPNIDVTLTIAGSGAQREQLVRQAAGAGLAGCVRFVGRLDRDEIADLNRQSDIVVNPHLHGENAARMIPGARFDKLAGIGHRVHHARLDAVLDAARAMLRG